MAIRKVLYCKINHLTISSLISGVMLMLLLRILRTSDVEAPSDLQVIKQVHSSYASIKNKT